MAVDRPGRSPNRPEPKRDRREISRNRLPTQTPQAGRQDRSAASCDDRRRRNPVVSPSIHPKPSKVMESETRENHQVFRRVQLGAGYTPSMPTQVIKDTLGWALVAGAAVAASAAAVSIT